MSGGSPYPLAPAVVLAFLLVSCGDGGSGGGVVSTPPPLPTPSPTPSPVNSNISNLVADQVFTPLSSGSSEILRIPDAEILSAQRDDRPISFSYDFSSNTYTVAKGPTSSQFSPSDTLPNTYPGEAIYEKALISDRLTLVTRSYSASTAYSSVAMGYWQRNKLTSGTQDTDFDIFVYGFPTPVENVPLSGNSSYTIDIFGLLATPGEEAKVLTGQGAMHFDFAAGVWSVATTLGEYPLASYNYTLGGSLKFNAAGYVGSKNSLDGSFNYRNLIGENVSGEVAGALYGPQGQELGAVFSGDTGTGAVVNGAITGLRDSQIISPSLALTNIVGETRINGTFADVVGANQYDLIPTFRGANGNTFGDYPNIALLYLGDGKVEVLLSNQRLAIIQPEDRVAAGDPLYDKYETANLVSALSDPGLVTFTFYKPGPTDGPIELTYSSFGTISRSDTDGATYHAFSRQFFGYGFDTPAGLLSSRAGTATYSGIAIGMTTNSNGQPIDVDGTSEFVVDFGTDSYSGSLDLAAHDGTTVIELGTFNFASSLADGLMNVAKFDYPEVLRESVQTRNQIAPVFYGPSGEEIIAPFSILVGGPYDIGSTTITGVAAATRD